MTGAKAGGRGGVPERTCIGCRIRGPKPDLIRLVRGGPEGSLALDPTGTASGRGAYVHGADCLEAAAGRRTLGRALRTTLKPGEAARLRAEIERIQSV